MRIDYSDYPFNGTARYQIENPSHSLYHFKAEHSRFTLFLMRRAEEITDVKFIPAVLKKRIEVIKSSGMSSDSVETQSQALGYEWRRKNPTMAKGSPGNDL
jgi:predicted ArsR family transcriptional regulator